MDGAPWTEPRIEASEVCVVEMAPGASLSPSDCDLLTDANVILYDHRLEAALRETWPIGSYGEPLSPESVAGNAAEAPRALALARDGWKVLVIVALPGDRPANVVELRQRDRGDERRHMPAFRSPPAREASRLFTANGPGGSGLHR